MYPFFLLNCTYFISHHPFVLWIWLHLGVFWRNSCRKLTFYRTQTYTRTHTHSWFSQGCCAYGRERSEHVWLSETNASGALCPQVHYSLWHWSNWLMWPCNNEYMKLKIKQDDIRDDRGILQLLWGETHFRLLNLFKCIVMVE